ncbi:small subunit ribosomal protein S5 [Lewinella marina]|uniref:Small ribosomal subunit protein uS5 n=1 Tax=Neolewinella marina TaxID=438751 RepID=A0A2G0CHK3_9BACT|nr:30S ribosomal protein S5 [Neolewinella marina]NJB86122.1 small subunit ribosomal protein S5 [Neolewinella marina]PHK99400.1 30S ribosomal protein S5 [Neolewinella marina]
MADNRNNSGGGRSNRRDNRDNRGRNNRGDQHESDLKEKMVALNRVSKVTKGGRTFTFAAIVVVGDGKGKVGHGMGKARDISEAIQKATDVARKSMIKIPLFKGTIPHEQLGKYGAGKVLLKPASEGTGVIAGGAMRAVLDIAGVHNVLAKSQGSSNPHNVIKATIDALQKLRSPQLIAKQRGISMEKLFEG